MKYFLSFFSICCFRFWKKWKRIAAIAKRKNVMIFGEKSLFKSMRVEINEIPQKMIAAKIKK